MSPLTKRAEIEGPNTRVLITVHLVAAVIIGVLYTVSLLGSEPINPVESIWILNGSDPSQHFLSWQVYRQDESWPWPLTMSRNLGYPGSVSVAYTDSIPILALAGKLLSGWLPERFQCEETVMVSVPQSDDGILLFSLRSSRLFSPEQAGVSDDRREFGVGIRRIRLLPGSEEP